MGVMRVRLEVRLGYVYERHSVARCRRSLETRVDSRRRLVSMRAG